MDNCSADEAASRKKRKARQDEGALKEEEDSSDKKNSRNERKRQLEKKRRDEVNSGLDKMMELLFEIDPKSRAESRERQMGSHEGADTSLTKFNSLHALNRVELIHRSTELLRTLHYENQDLKKLVNELAQGTTNASSAKPPSSAQVAPPPQLQLPRMGADNFPVPTQNLERSESAPVAILNALREERQALIDKQRAIDASLEMIRSSRLGLPTTGPRREVSLDLGGTTNLQRQAAARREEEIRLAQYASLGKNFGETTLTGQPESAHVLANLRKNRDDLLDETSEQSNREDALSALQRSYSLTNQATDLSQEDLLARLRGSHRELFMAGSRLGGMEHTAENLFLQLQNPQRMAERFAMEARMPDSLARSRTLDPALLLRHRNANNNNGQQQHRMF